MKKLLTIIALFTLISCQEESNLAIEFNKTILTTRVYQASSLSTGEVIETPVGMYYFMWFADGKDFIIRSYSDLIDGYAYDQTSETSIKYASRALEKDGSYIDSEIEPGDYFIVVMAIPDGKYSYTQVTLAADQDLEIKKVFTKNSLRLAFEEWGK